MSEGARRKFPGMCAAECEERIPGGWDKRDMRSIYKQGREEMNQCNGEQVKRICGMQGSESEERSCCKRIDMLRTRQWNAHGHMTKKAQWVYQD